MCQCLVYIWQVGDTIELLFRNNAGAGFVPPLQFSVHPHGVKYTKHNEGVHYQFEVDGSGSVDPGKTFLYKVCMSPMSPVPGSLPP